MNKKDVQATHNRTRNVEINFRVTPEEKEIIENRVKLSGLSKREYYTQSLMHQRIICQGNIRVTDEMAKQLRRIETHLENIIDTQKNDGPATESLRSIVEILSVVNLKISNLK